MFGLNVKEGETVWYSVWFEDKVWTYEQLIAIFDVTPYMIGLFCLMTGLFCLI